MTGMVQTDLAHPPATKFKDEPAEDPVSAFSLLSLSLCYFPYLPVSSIIRYLKTMN